MSITKRLAGLIWISLLIANLWGGVEDIPQVPAGVIGAQDSLFDAALVAGRKFILADRYEEAVAYYDSILTLYPEQPGPHFFLAATYQSWMGTYRISAYQEPLEKHVNETIRLGEKLLETRPEDPWLNFYIGAAYGYRAFFKVLSFNFIGAYLDGRKGIDNLETCLDKNPEIYDVYLGLGSYHYWRTARSKFIRVVAFWMSDLRDLGLKQIRFAAEHGRYSRPECMLGLVVAYFDYEKYDEGLEALAWYNESYDYKLLTSYYYHGRLLMAKKRYQEAIPQFEEMLRGLHKEPGSALGFAIECNYWIAKAYREMGDKSKALHYAGLGLVDLEKRNDQAELDGPFESFSDIKDKLKDLHKELSKS